MFGYFVWVFAWFYISSIVSPARRDIFVTPQVSDSCTIAGTTTTTTTTTSHNHNDNKDDDDDDDNDDDDDDNNDTTQGVRRLGPEGF